jgi:hypothetical protein
MRLQERSQVCPGEVCLILLCSKYLSLARVFIDALTVLPTETARLGHPNLNIEAAGFSLGFWVTCMYFFSMGQLIFTVYKTHVIRYIAYVMILST